VDPTLPEVIFDGVWEAWKAGFMAFHAFHTLSFPWPALGAGSECEVAENPGGLNRSMQHWLAVYSPGLAETSLSGTELARLFGHNRKDYFRLARDPPAIRGKLQTAFPKPSSD